MADTVVKIVPLETLFLERFSMEYKNMCQNLHSSKQRKATSSAHSGNGNLFNRMNWYIMIRFKCILQNDETDCGLACQAAIFRKYGLKVTIAKIRDIAGTDRQGTNAHGLVKVIEHFGF